MKRSERIAQNIPQAEAPAYVFQQMAFALGGTAVTTLTGWISAESFADGSTSGMAGGFIGGAIAVGLAYHTVDSVIEGATTAKQFSSANE